jgi:hypothetical protein
MITFDNPAQAVLLTSHIATGVIGLLAGFGALALRKGGRLHRLAGKVFIPTMVLMLAQAAILSLMLPPRTDWVGTPFLIYLTLTAWAAARFPDGLGRYGRGLTLFGAASVAMIVGLIALGLLSGNAAASGPQAVAPYILGLVALLTIGLDVRLLVRGGITGPPRIRRHIWRVSTALFVASGSFFLGQMDEFPRAIQGPVWFIPALAPLVLMIFWLWRYRDRKRRKPKLPALAAPEAA